MGNLEAQILNKLGIVKDANSNNYKPIMDMQFKTFGPNMSFNALSGLTNVNGVTAVQDDTHIYYLCQPGGSTLSYDINKINKLTNALDGTHKGSTSGMPAPTLVPKAIDDTYLYCLDAASGSTCFVKKIRKSDMTIVATSPALPFHSNQLLVDATNIYVMSDGVASLKKLNIGTLGVVGTYEPVNQYVVSMGQDENYIYWATYNGNTYELLQKVSKTDMSLVGQSSIFSACIPQLGSPLLISGRTAIIMSNATAPIYLKKVSLDTLVIDPINYDGNAIGTPAYRAVLDDDYLYLFVSKTLTIKRLRDLMTVKSLPVVAGLGLPDAIFDQASISKGVIYIFVQNYGVKFSNLAQIVGYAKQ